MQSSNGEKSPLINAGHDATINYYVYEENKYRQIAREELKNAIEEIKSYGSSIENRRFLEKKIKNLEKQLADVQKSDKEELQRRKFAAKPFVDLEEQLRVQPLAFKTAHDQSNGQSRQAILKEIIREQLEKISYLANSTNSSDERNVKGYVLSNQVRTFSGVSENIYNEINKMKEQAQLLIRTVAIDIEINNGKNGALTIDNHGNVQYDRNPSLPKDLNSKRERLLKAKLTNNVTVRSAAIALELSNELRNSFREQVAKESPQKKAELVVKQIVLTYELTDIIFEFINGLTLEGNSVIDELYQEAQRNSKKRIVELERLIQEMQNLQAQGLLSAEDTDKQLETTRMMKLVNERILHSWQGLLAQKDAQTKFLANLQKKENPLISYIRDMAKVTLNILRSSHVNKELVDAIADIERSTQDLDQLRLDEDTINELLGYDDAKDAKYSVP